jgi:two-component system, chemotaxis family, response regulator WspF
MRIAIVNDVEMITTTLRKVISTVANYEIAWTARDGAEAVTKCSADIPDLILMDLFMPVMDGIEATRQIMQRCPCAILVVTASVEKNTAQVFEAMGHGALDAVSTPVLGMNGDPAAAQDLLNKIATLSKLIGKSVAKAATRSIPQSPRLVVIGSSTGGPKALAAILAQLPASFNAAVVIVQHVDAQFTPGMVDWLNEQSSLPVRLASSGDRLVPGQILVAGTNDHLQLRANHSLSYTPNPIDYPYRPSVDVFFKSVAQHWKEPGMAVLLTGMGRDGAEGLLALRQRGWHTIAQNQATCVVYGMPKAAVEMGAAVEVLPLDAIAPVLLKVPAIRR